MGGSNWVWKIEVGRWRAVGREESGEGGSEMGRQKTRETQRALSQLSSVPTTCTGGCVADTEYLFLVGGFAESQVLQLHLRREFGHLVKIIIPQDVSLTILKGKAGVLK